ncbi:hypothetical protein [Streptomyces luteolus]|uniref:Uncharacterized protein n=1 Tax=Streptomyces luteolus TaxID=3043615 RepID=A0ABT6SYB1_9ACTN|nr:hypothetical protein [Streptomyces sp. B-S-A12]MDI3420581.1 hypothetical protein [Streptomyces sp. B-S-A12]
MTPTLKNKVTDPDGDKSTVTFEVWTTDAAGKPKTKVNLNNDNPYGVIVSEPVASGKNAEITVPWGKLSPGQTYTFHTSAHDGSLYETEWSPWAKFKLRERAVDIILPAPDKAAPNPAHDDSWQPMPGWGTVDWSNPARKTTKPEREEHCETSTDGKSEKCLNTRPATKDDLEVAEEARSKMKSTRALTPPLHAECEDVSVGKYLSLLKRDRACMYQVLDVSLKDKATNQEEHFQRFLTSYQMQTDMAGKSIQLWSRLTPMPMPEGKKPFPAQPGAIKLTISPQCEGCEDKPSYDWSGQLMWGGSFDIDPHEETGTETLTWSGAVTDAASTKDIKRTLMMSFAPYGQFSTSVPGNWDVSESHGQIGNPAYVRCDTVYTKPGCVMPQYMPGYVFNTKKTPAAAAHAWLMQEKIRGQAPLNYLPDRRGTTGVHGERNAFDRDPDANRKVICPDGWAKDHGHPGTTAVTDISSGDLPSCDEFTFAASYQSGGMPKAMKPAHIEGGQTAPVGSGDECLQTFSRKLTSSGNWHLFDDDRQAAPTFNEKCGRSTMSGWINSTSMSRFPAFAKKFHLLDQDAYFVRTPGFEKCDASGAVVKCDIR